MVSMKFMESFTLTQDKRYWNVDSVHQLSVMVSTLSIYLNYISLFTSYLFVFIFSERLNNQLFALDDNNVFFVNIFCRHVEP